MVHIRRNQSKYFELEPSPLVHDRHNSKCQNRARRKAIDGVLTDSYRRESQQEGESRHHLRVVMQRVQHHRPRHGEQQHQVDQLVINHARVLNEMHRIRREINKGPPAANQRPRKYSIPVFALEKYAKPQNRETSRRSPARLFPDSSALEICKPETAQSQSPAPQCRSCSASWCLISARYHSHYASAN